MGYYTYYSMAIHEADKFPNKDSVMLDKDEHKVLADSKVAVSKNITFKALEDGSIKWYNHDEDMDAISKEMEDYVFVLYGDGEESDDKWKKIYYNGKHVGVNAEDYYPPIDLSEVGLTNPDDYSAPKVKPINEYFWNKE